MHPLKLTYVYTVCVEQYSIVLVNVIYYYTILYNTILQYILYNSILQYYTACTTILYYTVLHCLCRTV